MEGLFRKTVRNNRSKKRTKEFKKLEEKAKRKDLKYNTKMNIHMIFNSFKQ